jgi:hypothetical protein
VSGIPTGKSQTIGGFCAEELVSFSMVLIKIAFKEISVQGMQNK